MAAAAAFTSGSVGVLADNDHGGRDRGASHGSYDEDHGKRDEDHGNASRGDRDDEHHDRGDREHGRRDDDHHGRDKVGVCHLTGSETNPVVFLWVSERAAGKHESRHGDQIGVDSIDECGATPPPPPPPAPIAMCADLNLSSGTGSPSEYLIDIEYAPDTGNILYTSGALTMSGILDTSANGGEVFAAGNTINFAIGGFIADSFESTSLETTSTTQVEFPLSSSSYFGTLILSLDACVDLPPVVF